MSKNPALTRLADDKILDAAARLFRNEGYDATTVREVARAAGCFPGSLHYRYASKEELLVALMGRAVDRLIAAVVEATARAVDPVDRVRLALRAHLRMLLSGDDAVYVLLYDFRSLSPRAAHAMARQRQRYDSFADELVGQAADAGAFRAGVDSVLLRRLGFGAVNWAAQWYDPNGAYTPEAIADHFFQYLTWGSLAESWSSDQKARPRATRAARRRAR